jgi:hypothetical protein
MTRCSATRADGDPCRAHHIADSPYCFWHSPDTQERRIRAARRGGQATLSEMQERRHLRQRRLESEAQLERALAAAASLGLRIK